MSRGVKRYAVLVTVVLVALWTTWPLRPTGARSEFEQQCADKAGDVAEMEDGTGLICVKGRKVVLREHPPIETRKA